jgi:predicted transcriptional regulator
MSTLVELTSVIIASQAASTSMTSEELLKSIQLVLATLKAPEADSPIAIEPSIVTEAPKLSIKQAFKKDEVFCMVCGKGGFKSLKRHLT